MNQKRQCKCGAWVDELSSYFGVPLHRHGSRFVVCPRWSGLVTLRLRAVR